MEINWDNFKIAEELIGNKAILLGGGQIANAFVVVNVLSVNKETGQVKVFDGKTEMNPYMWSYYIRPIREDLIDLEPGDYFISLNGEIRRQDCGLFGTIYDCTLVKKFIDEERGFEDG